MRKSDKKYAGEYMMKPSSSRFSDDSVIYIGKWYYFVCDEKTVKRSKILLFATAIIQMDLFLFGALIDSLASYTPYVFLPMIILALPLGLNVSCACSSLSFKEKVTHKQYDKKIVARKYYEYASASLSAVTLACNIVMCVIEKESIGGKELIFTAFMAIIVILSVLSLKLQKNMACSTDC